MTYKISGAVSTYETLEKGNTPIHFYFEVEAGSSARAQSIADTILDNSFKEVEEYSELIIDEV